MEPRDSCACEHEFVLVLGGIAELTDDVLNAFYEAGCDDATASMRFGRVYLTFSRTASSLKAAILSAIGDVLKANVGASVLSADNCNLVTQADIARRIGRSRQLVNQFIAGKRGPGNFPGPICSVSEGSPLWQWCEVAHWLRQNDMIEKETARDALDIATINGVLYYVAMQRSQPVLTREIVEFLGVATVSAVAADQ